MASLQTASQDPQTFGSFSSVTNLLIEAIERRSTLQKALEVEEATVDASSALQKNNHYTYAQGEIANIPSRKEKAVMDLEAKFKAFKETKEAKAAAIREEMELHIESYRNRKLAEIAALEKEIEVKESAYEANRAAAEKKYEDQMTHYSSICEQIAEKAGVPNAVGYRRKKAELDLVNKRIQDLMVQADSLKERDLKKMKEESLRRLDEERRREDEQRHRDLQVVQAQRAAEREADERKQREREERKKALRTALRACKTLDDVYDVENEQEYMDWEDEELVNSFKKRMRDRSETASHNEIVEEDKGAPLAPPKPVAENTILGSAQILKTTKMMPKTPGVPAQRLPRPF